MTLWFLTDSAVVWTPERLRAVNTLDLGGGVDGAEAMTVGLCQHLAQRGHDVTLWATHCEAPGLYGYTKQAVRWRPAETWLRRALITEPSPDVFIAVRRPEVFSLPEYQMGCTAFRILWTHDVFQKERIPYLENVDGIVYVSQWHRQQWEASYPPLASRNFFGWVTPVALEPSWIPDPLPTDHDRTTFLYASRPERGLVPLLQMWPALRQRIPGATLIVTGYTAGTSQLVQEADALIRDVHNHVGGIEIQRSPDKRGFYRQLRRARLLLYPGVPWFAETNGHVCSEAMVCGTVPVVTKIGALSETIPPDGGRFVEGDASSPEYQRTFIDLVVELSSGEATPRTLQVGFDHVLPRCAYESVAALWERSLYAIPRKGVNLCQT